MPLALHREAAPHPLPRPLAPRPPVPLQPLPLQASFPLLRMLDTYTLPFLLLAAALCPAPAVSCSAHALLEKIGLRDHDHNR
ncbi:hypothetical protein EJB05_34792, partial [Eragrostis curvula]